MFITFEGPDGSGKTTAINHLVDYLKSKGIDFILTREPGTTNSSVNRRIREIIVDKESVITPMAEAILFSADRRLHLEQIIWPAMKENKLVLCDRYFDSTFAYQGSGRNLGIDKMIDLQENITDKTYPDLTFYFDVSVKESIARVEKRGDKNRLDSEGREFVEKVHKGYKEVIKRNPKRFVIIDASKSPEEVFQAVKKEFAERVLSK